MEISCVEKLTRSTTVDGETFVDRIVGRSIGVRNHRHNRVALKSRDRAVLAGEDEPRCTRRADAVVDYKPAAAVKDEPGGIPLRAAGAGNGEDRDGSGTYVIERCLTGAIVGNPPWCCRTCIKSPRVNQVRIGMVG